MLEEGGALTSKHPNEILRCAFKGVECVCVSITTSHNYFLFTGQALERSLLTHQAAHGLFLLGFPAACYTCVMTKMKVSVVSLTTAHTLGTDKRTPKYPAISRLQAGKGDILW